MVGDTLGDLSGRLLVQCRPGQAKNAARVASAHGTGLVLTGRMPRPTVEALRAHGFTGPILCDANRYSGRRRAPAGAGTRESWAAEQHELGLVALTDSGYLAPHDWHGLRRILADARDRPGPTAAMLPLAARWFEHSVDGLAEEIEQHGVPVAVAIEHAKDPFGVRYVARGFVSLLAVPVPVILLRSDISALGALAHGTHAAAIGTTTRLRRIPPRTRRGAVGFPALRVFVPPLLGHHPLDSVSRLTPYWRCDCHECAGHPLTDLTRTARPEVSAFRHSLSAQLTLWSALDAADSPVNGWLEHCGRALSVHRQLATTQPAWYPPANLHSWTHARHPARHPARSDERAHG
ncbi:hypothetical protein [Actinophytocola sp.]|uniref:hypothetical protein n=1 Tax=Actinophytocola sp. TaxID=1872138 RepID=UPI003D6AC15D